MVITRLTRLSLSGAIIWGFFCAAAATATAEDVRIRSHYPSPYGVYNSVTTTGNSRFASEAGVVELVENGGRVEVGQASPEAGGAGAQRTLSVIGEIPGRHTANFRHFSGWGVEIGGYPGGGIFAGAGSAQGTLNGAANRLNFNHARGDVGIGVTDPLYTLHVNGTIGIVRAGGAQNGELRLSRAADGNYYGHYAS